MLTFVFRFQFSARNLQTCRYLSSPGLVGYTPEHLIEIFVEEKTTGVEMCPLMETELLTVKDPPVLSMTPKPTHTPHEKSR